MKTDRELLELAAKAAGLRSEWSDVAGCMNLYADSAFKVRTGRWDPKRENLDAFKLAVKLRLDINFYEGSQYVCVTDYLCDHSSSTDYTDDRYRDVRLAILDCAAQIGESMP